MAIPDELLEVLQGSGFERRGEWTFAGEHGEEWQLAPAGTARYVYFRSHAGGGGAGELYSIYVEEWRGGEGYEDEEFRGGVGEALAAIPHWAAWAREPFVPRVGVLERILRRFRRGSQ